MNVQYVTISVGEPMQSLQRSARVSNEWEAFRRRVLLLSDELGYAMAG